jgi:predicted alpha/beta superfamily hydrolase
MSKILLLFVLLLAVGGKLFSQDGSTPESSVVGNLKLLEFSSKTFGNTRMIRVLLPPGYDDKANRNKRYAVLYLNDGQNLFDVKTSAFNPLEWEVDETVDRQLKEKKIAPLIVVGIDSAGKQLRFNEYFPYEDKYLQPPIPSPEGKKYPNFLIKEVMPFINARYRTKVDSASTGVGGSSAGAVAALYAVIARPGVFGKLLMESASLYISDAQLIKDSEMIRDRRLKVYMGVGTNEGGRVQCKPDDLNHEAVQDVLKLKKVLQTAGFDDRRLKVVVEDCTQHNEAVWAKRFPIALEFLYGKE